MRSWFGSVAGHKFLDTGEFPQGKCQVHSYLQEGDRYQGSMLCTSEMFEKEFPDTFAYDTLVYLCQLYTVTALRWSLTSGVRLALPIILLTLFQTCRPI